MSLKLFIFAILLLNICTHAHLVYAKSPELRITAVSGAFLRSKPTTASSYAHTLPLGTVVRILKTSPKTETIDGSTAYWYHVRLVRGGRTGWLFGGVLIPFERAQRTEIYQQLIDTYQNAPLTFGQQQDFTFFLERIIEETRDPAQQAHFGLTHVTALQKTLDLIQISKEEQENPHHAAFLKQQAEKKYIEPSTDDPTKWVVSPTLKTQWEALALNAPTVVEKAATPVTALHAPTTSASAFPPDIPEAVTDSYLIYPAKSFGLLKLAAPRAHIHELLGKPHNPCLTKGKITCDNWEDKHSQSRIIVYYQDDKVVQIESSSPIHTLMNGISIHSHLSELQRAFQNLTQQTTPQSSAKRSYWQIPAQGITFVIGKDERVENIIVHSAQQAVILF